MSVSEHTYSDTSLFQLSPQECSPEGPSLDTSQAFQDDMRQTCFTVASTSGPRGIALPTSNSYILHHGVTRCLGPCSTVIRDLAKYTVDSNLGSPSLPPQHCFRWTSSTSPVFSRCCWALHRHTPGVEVTGLQGPPRSPPGTCLLHPGPGNSLGQRNGSLTKVLNIGCWSPGCYIVTKTAPNLQTKF